MREIIALKRITSFADLQAEMRQVGKRERDSKGRVYRVFNLQAAKNRLQQLRDNSKKSALLE